MAFSASLRPNLPSTSSQRYIQICFLGLNRKHSRLDFVANKKSRGLLLKTFKSVLNDEQSSVNEYGAADSARILLERLFKQTQKLEEQMTAESFPGKDIQLGLNLQVLESDLEAALTALKRKEEHLEDAKRMVLLENSRLNHMKGELERQEREITAAGLKYGKLEEELKGANLNLVSQAREIGDLKLLLRQKDQEIAAVQTARLLKEEEIERMKTDLAKKSQEAASMDSELKSKAQLLNDANGVIKKHEIEVQGLRKAIREKETQLGISVAQKKIEEDKLKGAEANLEKLTMVWLTTQEELKKMGEKASRLAQESNQTMVDYRRVKKLLDEVRSELVSSQQSLAYSRTKMEEQEQLMEKQLVELAQQRESIMSYIENLKDAQIELESERVKFSAAEARNKELERDLYREKDNMEELQEELKKERFCLEQAAQEMSLLQEQLEQKNVEFRETSANLHVKESELVEAKLEIKRLKAEKASLQAILEETDLELSNARKKLEEVNQEISDLKILTNNKERQLIEATNMLKEKDEHVQIMQNELNNTKLKASEAENVVERILELTNKLVASSKDQDIESLRPLDEMGNELKKPTDEFNWQQKRLENELTLTKESLKAKEMEVLAAQSALAIKDEELKSTLARLDAKENKLKKMKKEMTEDANDLKRLYALAQERIGEKSIGDLAIEKLQLEAAQLEAEAATSALHKLVVMSRQLLNKASRSVEADDYITVLQNNTDSITSIADNIGCFTEVKTGIAKLSAMTEQLVKEAGMVAVN